MSDNNWYYQNPHYDGYLQLSHQTAKDRFPKIFDTARQIRPDAKRILSFGCSTGEECFSLAEHFPAAEIVGVDIDYPSVQQARKANKSDRVFFHTELGATGTYDIATCLMVLFSLENPVPRERWNEAVRRVDSRLNPGGLWVIYTSDYDIREETEVFEKYTPVREWKRTHQRNSKQYFCGYYLKKKERQAMCCRECGKPTTCGTIFCQEHLMKLVNE